MKLNKGAGGSMEVNQPTDSKSIVNKWKQSKSSISTPRPNYIKNNQSNKRHKKDNTRSDTLESHIPPSSEHTTRKFNYIYVEPGRIPIRQRKFNCYLTDPIYKRPFEHGWKRELILRKPSKSAVMNPAYDVYYFCPTYKRFGSIQEIQKHLDNMPSDRSYLLIQCFTFTPIPIYDDDHYERIRDADFVLYKESSNYSQCSCNTLGVPVKSEYGKTSSRSKKEHTTRKFNYIYVEPGCIPIRQRKFDCFLANRILKRPFEHGWKRELILKKTSNPAANNPANDVYYYSPNYQRFGSLQEIQKHLDISSDKTSLNIKCFSFIPLPIYEDNDHYERIRNSDFALY